jgi:hypothetical protein
LTTHPNHQATKPAGKQARKQSSKQAILNPNKPVGLLEPEVNPEYPNITLGRTSNNCEDITAPGN